MKLNRNTLRRIIKEELSRVLREQDGDFSHEDSSGRLVYEPLEITGSRPRHNEDVLILGVFSGAEGGLEAPAWGNSPESAVTAFYQVLGDQMLNHLRSLSTRAQIETAADNLAEAIQSRMEGEDELYTSAMLELVSDAEAVAISNLPAQGGMARPD